MSGYNSYYGVMTLYKYLALVRVDFMTGLPKALLKGQTFIIIHPLPMTQTVTTTTSNRSGPGKLWSPDLITDVFGNRGIGSPSVLHALWLAAICRTVRDFVCRCALVNGFSMRDRCPISTWFVPFVPRTIPQEHRSIRSRSLPFESLSVHNTRLADG